MDFSSTVHICTSIKAKNSQRVYRDYDSWILGEVSTSGGLAAVVPGSAWNILGSGKGGNNSGSCFRDLI
jgi:hypothetical protein